MIVGFGAYSPATSVPKSGGGADETDPRETGKLSLKPDAALSPVNNRIERPAQLVRLTPLSVDALLAVQSSDNGNEGVKEVERGGQANTVKTGNDATKDLEKNSLSAPKSDEENQEEGKLTEAQETLVAKLRQRDAEVRTHEMAHMAAGGPYAGSASYTYQQGPDGKKYAIGGEVPIDTSPEQTPEATIQKMQIVAQAAMAPADPSPQDMKVAQYAQSMIIKAQAEKNAEDSKTARDGQEATSDNEVASVAQNNSASDKADNNQNENAIEGQRTPRLSDRARGNAAYRDTSDALRLAQIG